MPLYAVSDLHITGPDDPLYASLLKILRERVGPGDVVVLAGDIFDLFVGNKQVFKSRYAEFFEALRGAAGRGASLHYIEGNHDFLLKGAFAGVPGMTVHPRQFELPIGERRFYFAHGDLVDREDYGYRALRLLFRSPLMWAFVTLMPGFAIRWIGDRLSKASSGQKPRLPTGLPAERIEYLRNTYRSYAAERLAQGCDYVVMGHCHDLDEKSFIVDGREGQYVNVGYPRAHGSFLSWSPGDDKIRREGLPR